MYDSLLSSSDSLLSLKLFFVESTDTIVPLEVHFGLSHGTSGEGQDQERTQGENEQFFHLSNSP